VTAGAGEHREDGGGHPGGRLRGNLGAHAVALAGVLWEMVAVAADRGPQTQLNDSYHRVMVVLLAATLILLLTPLGRNSLGQERK
jgi:hypothetical protein